MKNKPLKNPSLFTPGSLVFLQTVRLSRLFTGNGSIGRTFCCADEILKSRFLLHSKSLFPLHGFTELLFTCFPLNRKIPSLFHLYGKNVQGVLALILQDTGQQLSACAGEKTFPDGHSNAEWSVIPKASHLAQMGSPTVQPDGPRGAQHRTLCTAPKGLLIWGAAAATKKSSCNS